MSRYCICLILALLLLPAPVAGQQESPSLSFADALFAEGDYYRAITEYKRYLHHFPQGAEASRAALEIGRSYLAGGRYEQADEAFDRVRLVY
ncbi:MAG: tetratricopeptide repeat protein, partial [Desulfuromonadales bacterium]|nr:tetratricopeptide repeat protein [Desulfuromonadales bacterium]NIS42342.1 tetratricopeptide repeat protein [Desulfuromonadales bacterium]